MKFLDTLCPTCLQAYHMAGCTMKQALQGLSAPVANVAVSCRSAPWQSQPQAPAVPAPFQWETAVWTASNTRTPDQRPSSAQQVPPHWPGTNPAQHV